MSLVDRDSLLEYIRADPMNQIRLNIREPGLVSEALREDSLVALLREDPVLFSRLLLGINPTGYQEELLRTGRRGSWCGGPASRGRRAPWASSASGTPASTLTRRSSWWPPVSARASTSGTRSISYWANLPEGPGEAS